MAKRLFAAGLFSLLAFSLSWFWYPTYVKAVSGASIFVGPASGTFTVGSTFTVSVYVNTGGQSINAIEANLSFPPDKLQVVTPSAGKSLIQIWVNQPTYSNEGGSLKFQGTIPSPGINTESGLISTVTFRVKSTGTATVKILDSSRVLLNDGRGTDVLGQTTSGVYTLSLPPPNGPVVVSPSHPDQQKWYAEKDATFSWDSPPGASGFSYILNGEPVDTPDDISEGLRNSVAYKNLGDGIHYFHIRALREGTWGGVSHYAVNIDNTPPASFNIDVSPSDNTSNRFPIISFDTTDAVSGIDHYELKIIPLDKPDNGGGKSIQETPFFVEATSPYSRQLDLGRYDVVVRAYDHASNFVQITKRLTITTAIFEFVSGKGLKVGGSLISWVYVWIFGLILLLGLGFLGRLVWKWHRQIEKRLEEGALKHPSVASKIQDLKDKQQEYHSNSGLGMMVVGLLILGFSIFGFGVKAMAAQDFRLPVEPPIVTLFPTSLSNNEILYVGGRAGAPQAQVIIYIQNTEGGEAISQSVKTDKNGEWFLSLGEFLNPGKYEIWTQLRVGEELSPPSSKLDLVVARTAVQFGEKRVSYESLYLISLIIILIVFFAGLGFVIYHGYHHRVKKAKLLIEIKEAEESVRRGFLLLRKDIEGELAVVRRAKMTKELAVEEKMREEKLLKDLEWVNGYIGKEVWEVEKEV